MNETERARNRKKSKVRSRVEHVIGVIKLTFGFTKVRYRGLEKNANRLFATCGLTNLYILRHCIVLRLDAYRSLYQHSRLREPLRSLTGSGLF